MQFAEGLSDRQAASAVRSRIDWKYILGLELTDRGIDHSILSEFRTRLLESGEEEKLLEVMLNQLKQTSLIKQRGKQRTTNWTGYKVHLTESCDSDLPHLITNVETTPATTNDVEVTSTIHQSLAHKQLLPKKHLLDTGYVDAENLVTSADEYQVELVGRVLSDNSWQNKSQSSF